MAFQAPAGQEKANRKILEQLEEQKKRLRMQAHNPPVTTTPVTTAISAPHPPSSSVPVLSQESLHMTPAQRAALQHAHANSVGYFITQDSSFGNLILPVLPRLQQPVVEK